LLVNGATPGPLFVSFRPHDDGILDRAGGELLLSFARGSALLPGHKHRRIPHRVGNAFPERRVGGHGSGSGARVRLDYGVCFSWVGLGLARPDSETQLRDSKGL
jgi:hypothetical protein